MTITTLKEEARRTILKHWDDGCEHKTEEECKEESLRFCDEVIEKTYHATKEEVRGIVEAKKLHYKEVSNQELERGNTMLAYDFDSRYVAAKHILAALENTTTGPNH